MWITAFGGYRELLVPLHIYTRAQEGRPYVYSNSSRKTYMINLWASLCSTRCGWARGANVMQNIIECMTPFTWHIRHTNHVHISKSRPFCKSHSWMLLVIANFECMYICNNPGKDCINPIRIQEQQSTWTCNSCTHRKKDGLQTCLPVPTSPALIMSRCAHWGTSKLGDMFH